MSKIIFWINDTLIHFGIAKSLQENSNVELYGLISVADKKKDFFKNQKIVNFKKFWFLDEIKIDSKNNYSLDYLKNIEQKYNLNLWNIIYNDRIFFNFNEFYKFSRDQVLSIVEQELRLFEKILDEVKPDFVCLYPVLRTSYLFSLICKSRNITPIIFQASRIPGKSMINANIDALEFKKSVNLLPKIDSNFTLEEFLNQSMQKQVSKEAGKWLKPKKKTISSAVFKFLFSDNTGHKTNYAYYGRSKTKVLINYIYNYFRVRKRKNWLDKNAFTKIKSKKPFILFPLHLEQEMSLLIQAPFFTNQLEIIKSLVKSLPIGYELYVKEHPLMYARSWRKISTYEEILNLPNVKLIHPDVKTNELIEKCSLVSTILGTTSIDAGFFKKPAIIFSKRDDVPILSHIHQVKNLEELPSLIKKLINMECDNSEYFQYIEFIKKKSFDIDFSGLVKQYNNNFLYSGFLTDVEIDINEMQKFLENIKPQNDIIAEKIIEKINTNIS